VGPDYAARAIEAGAGAIDSSTGLINVASQLAGRMGEYFRRQDEWHHQGNLATIELKQIDQQLAAAQIRLDIAQQELRNHDQQIDDARAVDEFLRSKFTNQDLFQWMIGRVSAVYFQSYQLAYDLAKRAERCMQYELGLQAGSSSVILFGYWDSLRKGLLAGDQLSYDLKRLEIAYLDGNKREYEKTKHVSLRQVDPVALLQLRAAGTSSFTIPEELFDMDGPGHYFRRIKSVAVTIPCVAGPYTSVNCTLSLQKSSVRISTDLSKPYQQQGADDTRFTDFSGTVNGIVESIVTSSGQADSGLFDTNLRDKRYLPFEGSGVASSQRQITLP